MGRSDSRSRSEAGRPQPTAVGPSGRTSSTERGPMPGKAPIHSASIARSNRSLQIPVMAAVATFGLLLGCGSGQYVALDVQVVIPAEVRTISDGELSLRLWSYDPTVADLAATMTDVQHVSLSHAAGQRKVVP